MKKGLKWLFALMIGVSLFGCSTNENVDEPVKEKEMMTAEEMKTYEKGQVIKELPDKEINNEELEKRGLVALYLYDVTTINENGEKVKEAPSFTYKQKPKKEQGEIAEWEYEFREIRVFEIEDYIYANLSELMIGGAALGILDAPKAGEMWTQKMWLKCFSSSDETSIVVDEEGGHYEPLLGFGFLPVQRDELIQKLEAEKDEDYSISYYPQY